MIQAINHNQRVDRRHKAVAIDVEEVSRPHGGSDGGQFATGACGIAVLIQLVDYDERIERRELGIAVDIGRLAIVLPRLRPENVDGDLLNCNSARAVVDGNLEVVTVVAVRVGGQGRVRGSSEAEHS